ncbi:MAG: hypothetical protein KJP16_03975 [Gammaproteobacteria bacterium]|nr:hypothetical protein [Gammaproteobacteria bacterium]NNL49954.1 hypothetical protein [Woeseiaceae bacterium]
MLLKFATDRKWWRHWLFAAQRRFDLSVLNYIATSNHVHLLILDQGNGEIQDSAGAYIAEATARP